MIAINGVYAVFRVEAVMNVAGVSRDNTGRRQSGANKQGRKKEDLFSRMLKDTIGEDGEKPEVLQTTVYGRDGKMSDVRRRSKEYHY